MDSGRLPVASDHDAAAAMLFQIANDSLNQVPMGTVVATSHRQSEPRCDGASECFDMTQSDDQAKVGLCPRARDVRLRHVQSIHADSRDVVNTAASHEFRSQPQTLWSQS